MFNAFSRSYDAIKIRIIADNINSLQNQYNTVSERRNNAAEQLNQKRNELSDLENQYLNCKMTRESLKQELEQLDAQKNQLNTQLQNTTRGLEKANALKYEVENKLSKLRSENNLEQMKSEIDTLKNKIKSLDNIINQREPEVKTRIDGEYCINNIYHCKNHPPRQVVINQAEIDQHRKAVKDAIEEKQKLIEQLQDLEEKYNQQKGMESFLVESAQSAKEYSDACQDNVDSIKREIEACQDSYNKANSELESIRIKEANLDSAISSLRTNIYGLENDLNIQENSMHQLQNSLDDAQLELERAKDEYQMAKEQYNEEQESYWSKLKKLAAEEVRAEGVQIENAFNDVVNKFLQPNNNSGTENTGNQDSGRADSTPFTDPIQFPDAFSKKPEDMMDKVVDMAIDEARRIGAITAQAKRNLHFIRNFAYDRLKELKERFEEFQQGSSPPQSGNDR